MGGHMSGGQHMQLRVGGSWMSVCADEWGCTLMVDGAVCTLTNEGMQWWTRVCRVCRCEPGDRHVSKPTSLTHLLTLEDQQEPPIALSLCWQWTWWWQAHCRRHVNMSASTPHLQPLPPAPILTAYTHQWCTTHVVPAWAKDSTCNWRWVVHEQGKFIR